MKKHHSYQHFAIGLIGLIVTVILAVIFVGPEEPDDYIPVCEREYTVERPAVIDSTYQTLER